MDVIQDWATQFLANNNIPDLHHNPSYAFLLPYASRLYTTLFSLYKTTFSLLSAKPDLATLALLLIILFISLKLLNMLANTVLWWFRMLKSVVFWGGLVLLGGWMWQRGPEGVVEDVEGLWAAWNGEYRYWKDREEVARLANRAGVAGGVGGQRWF